MRYALFVIITLALTAFIGWGTYRTALLLRSWQPDRNLLLLPAENAVRVLLVLLCVALGLLSGLPWFLLGWAPPSPLADVGIGIIAGALLSLLLTAASHLAVSRWGQSIYSPVVLMSVLPRGRRQWALVLLALVPSVALEELLFRSLLLGGFRPILPAWFLVAALALLFGFMHLPQGPLGVWGTAAAGFFLALLFLWRSSILAPLVAHYVADVLQLVLASRGPSPWRELASPPPPDGYPTQQTGDGDQN